MAVLRTRALALAVALAAVVAIAGARAAEPREESGFGSNPGNLRMFSYVPDGLPASAPLVVVLHGCKQKAATFARDTGFIALADSGKFALLMPEQKGLPPLWYDYAWPGLMIFFGANNPNACFNWFEPGDIARDQGEALSIRQMIDTMIARYSLDPARVYITGLSAGGAMTAVMLSLYPERFAGGAVVAGIPSGCADTVSEAFQCMKPGLDLTPEEWKRRANVGSATRLPLVGIWHGDGDQTVAVRNRQELVDQWTALHGLPPVPTRSDTLGPARRDIFVGAGDVTRVESVTIPNFAHAFPIAEEAGASCGKRGDFVMPAGICAAREIARFWGLVAGN